MAKQKKTEDGKEIKEPQMPYSDYRVGQEFDGDIIIEIFSSHREFLIYRTRGSHAVTFYYYDIGTNYKENFSKISEKAALLKSCVSNKYTNIKFKSRIALAYREALVGNLDCSIKIIEKIIDEAHPFRKNLARIIYLISCFCAVLITISFSVIQDTIINSDYLIPYTKIMLFGSLGGFISVSISLRRLDLDYDFYNWSQSVYGLFRIVISIISAIIAYVLLKSGFIFSNINSDNYFMYYAVAVFAGFSETWIPNTLKKIESENSKEETTSH